MKANTATWLPFTVVDSNSKGEATKKRLSADGRVFTLSHISFPQGLMKQKYNYSMTRRTRSID